MYETKADALDQRFEDAAAAQDVAELRGELAQLRARWSRG